MTHIKRRRLEPETRRLDILEACLPMALDEGYRQLKRDAAADAAGVAQGTINHVFGSVSGLHDAMIGYAVDNEIEALVAQGLAVGDPIAREAPKKLIRSAINSLK